MEAVTLSFPVRGMCDVEQGLSVLSRNADFALQYFKFALQNAPFLDTHRS